MISQYFTELKKYHPEDHYNNVYLDSLKTIYNLRSTGLNLIEPLLGIIEEYIMPRSVWCVYTKASGLGDEVLTFKSYSTRDEGVQALYELLLSTLSDKKNLDDYMNIIIENGWLLYPALRIKEYGFGRLFRFQKFNDVNEFLGFIEDNF